MFSNLISEITTIKSKHLIKKVHLQQIRQRETLNINFHNVFTDILFFYWLTIPAPSISDSCTKIKTNFYFHTSLWCLIRFYEGLSGLHKTFWDTTMKCKNKKSSLFSLFLSMTNMKQITYTWWFEYFEYLNSNTQSQKNIYLLFSSSHWINLISISIFQMNLKPFTYP